jgi:hypothetical protein
VLDAMAAADMPARPPAPDAAGPAPDAAIGALCPAGALLCDDFEKYPADAPPPRTAWRTNLNGGDVRVDGTRAFSGARSVRVTTMADGKARSAMLQKQGAPLFPIEGNLFYGRMMIWLTDAPTTTHWANANARGMVPGTTTRATYMYGGLAPGYLSAGYLAIDSGNTLADCWKKSGGVTLPEQRWACVEWEFDGPNAELHYWLDGKPIDGLTVVRKGDGCGAYQGIWQGPVWDELNLGWSHAQTSPIPVEMWLDDVVIARQRVGCPAPR